MTISDNRTSLLSKVDKIIDWNCEGISNQLLVVFIIKGGDAFSDGQIFA